MNRVSALGVSALKATIVTGGAGISTALARPAFLEERGTGDGDGSSTGQGCGVGFEVPRKGGIRACLEPWCSHRMWARRSHQQI